MASRCFGGGGFRSPWPVAPLGVSCGRSVLGFLVCLVGWFLWFARWCLRGPFCCFALRCLVGLCLLRCLVGPGFCGSFFSALGRSSLGAPWGWWGFLVGRLLGCGPGPLRCPRLCPGLCWWPARCGGGVGLAGVGFGSRCGCPCCSCSCPRVGPSAAAVAGGGSCGGGGLVAGGVFGGRPFWGALPFFVDQPTHQALGVRRGDRRGDRTKKSPLRRQRTLSILFPRKHLWAKNRRQIKQPVTAPLRHPQRHQARRVAIVKQPNTVTTQRHATPRGRHPNTVANAGSRNAHPIGLNILRKVVNRRCAWS